MADPTDDFDSIFAGISVERAKQPDQAEPLPANEPEASAPSAPTPPKSNAPAADKPPAEEVSQDELKRQLEQALHRERSSAARISAFAKEANRLQGLVAELQRAKEQTPAAPVAAPAPVDDVLTAAPDLAQAVERRISEAVAAANKAAAEANDRADAAAQAAANAQASMDPFIERQRKEQQAQTWIGLDQRFKGFDWRKDIRSAEFDQWLPTAPLAIQELFDNGNTVDESAAVLALFYSATGKLPAPSTPQPSAADPNQARLRLAAGVAPRGVGKPSGPAADDFEGNFAAAARALKQA